MKHFREKNYICYGVNSHNKDSIKGLLTLVRNRIRELKGCEANYTTTVLLTGITNVGKSAIANSMHQVGRITATEKGKLKHAIVSPHPGETKDIISYKIASHPNIYILDSPGVLYPEVTDDDYGSKLALTGAIKDSLLDEIKVAQYFLLILSSSEQYKFWEKLTALVHGSTLAESKEKCLADSDTDYRRRTQYSSDHTKDFIVRDVRRTLFKTISSFEGNMQNETDVERLIESQFTALHEAFRLRLSGEDSCSVVASKLLNLYRTGRLGRYTLDLPRNVQ
ncbi:DAR GTPase 2, mitochondrial [Asparagus officinalis]|nr:DAR GTPase 2, mitochondrial [Asparagus officinalis]